MEQERMDERMLKTGTVPVADQLNRLPAAANGESKPHSPLHLGDDHVANEHSQRTTKADRGGRRRGGRTGETACSDGHVTMMINLTLLLFSIPVIGVHVFCPLKPTYLPVPVLLHQLSTHYTLGVTWPRCFCCCCLGWWIIPAVIIKPSSRNEAMCFSFVILK